MDDSVLNDLISLLRDQKPEVRQGAAEYMCSLTSSKEGCEMIARKKGHLTLAKLLGDRITTSKYAITALINMCDDAEVLTDLANNELVNKLMENLMDDSYPLINLNMMLLANVSTNDMGAGAILQIRQNQGKLKGLHLCRLVLWFLRTPVDCEEADPFQYVATILNNVTRLYDGRDLIMNENRKLIEKLIPYISSSNPIRRTGVINMVRNILLDDYYWDKLVDNWDTNGYLREIVYRVCANLNGNHIIEKHEVDPMITSLKKEREKNMDIIHISLDLLVIITKYQNGRELLREHKIYYVIRDMHMELDELLPQNILDTIGDLVTHLMADESQPSKKSGPTVEEVTEEPAANEGKQADSDSDSDSGLDDLPDLE